MYHDTDREERSSMIEMMEAECDSLGEMTEAEYGVLGEAAEAEYGICDLLDENIPSPLETDNAGETLVLPEIQDMTEYIGSFSSSSSSTTTISPPSADGDRLR